MAARITNNHANQRLLFLRGRWQLHNPPCCFLAASFRACASRLGKSSPVRSHCSKRRKISELTSARVACLLLEPGGPIAAPTFLALTLDDFLDGQLRQGLLDIVDIEAEQ